MPVVEWRVRFWLPKSGWNGIAAVCSLPADGQPQNRAKSAWLQREFCESDAKKPHLRQKKARFGHKKQTAQ